MHDEPLPPLDSLIDTLSDMYAGRLPTLISQIGGHGRAGDERAIPVLIDLLGHPNWIGEAASDALERIGPPAIEPVTAVFRNRWASLGARMDAARTLTHIKDPRSVEPMLEVLQDEDDDIRLRRVLALYIGRMRDRRVLEPLIEILSDPAQDAEMRGLAAEGLGELHDQTAVAALERVLEGEDVRFHTERGLQEWDKVRALEDKIERSEWERLMAQISGGLSLHHEVREVLRLLKPT